MDQDGSVYWASDARQQPGFGVIPVGARFVFLGTGSPGLFYVARDGLTYNAKDKSLQAHFGSVPPSADFVCPDTGKTTLYYVDQDGYTYLAKDEAGRPVWERSPKRRDSPSWRQVNLTCTTSTRMDTCTRQRTRPGRVSLEMFPSRLALRSSLQAALFSTICRPGSERCHLAETTTPFLMMMSAYRRGSVV